MFYIGHQVRMFIGMAGADGVDLMIPINMRWRKEIIRHGSMVIKYILIL